VAHRAVLGPRRAQWATAQEPPPQHVRQVARYLYQSLSLFFLLKLASASQ